MNDCNVYECYEKDLPEEFTSGDGNSVEFSIDDLEVAI